MRHVYRCHTRWADIDQLAHTNNVAYADYLQEARVDLLRGHRGDGGDRGVVVVRHEIRYLEPLLLRLFRPVTVETWVSAVRAASFTLDYEVHDDEPDGTRTVFASARSELAPADLATGGPRRLEPGDLDLLGRFRHDEGPSLRRTRVGEVPAEAWRYDVHVRFSDLDVYGHVNNVTYVEYLQEARLRAHAALARDLDVGPIHMVVAQVDLDYHRPMLLRPEPYCCRTWVSRLGERSMTYRSVVEDEEGRLYAAGEAAMVFVDPDTGRAARPPAAYRQRVEEALTRAC